MNEVSVSVSDVEPPSWLNNFLDFCKYTLEKVYLTDREVSVLLCSDRVITDLNKRYLDAEGPTDVLAFGQEDDELHIPGNKLLGDIVISLTPLTASSTTPSFTTQPSTTPSFADINAHNCAQAQEIELKRLFIHGLLHLMGMDHDTQESKQEMHSREESLLRELVEEKIF